MKNLTFTILLICCVLLSYFIFREILFKAESNPITFELTAGLIGVIVTTLITFLLLNKQTNAELKKEENILFLDLKAKIYTELMAQIQDILTKGEVKEIDRIEIKILNQKIAFIASEEVLEAFNEFSALFSQIARSNDVSDDEEHLLFESLSKVSVAIREDLLHHKIDKTDGKRVKELVLSSNKNFEN
jgi:hypothetical protein